MVNLRAQPRCSVKVTPKLGMTLLHGGATRMPSVPLSAAKEGVDVPGLKSVRLLGKQTWEHHSPLPSRPLGQSLTDLAIHPGKGIGMRAIASSRLYSKFNTQLFQP